MTRYRIFQEKIAFVNQPGILTMTWLTWLGESFTSDIGGSPCVGTGETIEASSADFVQRLIAADKDIIITDKLNGHEFLG